MKVSGSSALATLGMGASSLKEKVQSQAFAKNLMSKFYTNQNAQNQPA
jgi:hypothetical protein